MRLAVLLVPVALLAASPSSMAQDVSSSPGQAPSVLPSQSPPLPNVRARHRPVTRDAFVARREAVLMIADADKDGRISAAEWSAYWAQKGGKGNPHRRFARLDTNHDGYLDRTEIEAALADRFARLDRNGDGVLEPDERPARQARALNSPPKP